MFFGLLAATFALSAAVAFATSRIFHRPVGSILARIVAAELSAAWQKYLTFAIYVVGISGGVRIWELEKYIAPRGEEPPLDLTPERWTLEIYRTIIDTLQSIAWMLLVFFVFALIAYVVVRAFELRRGNSSS